MIVGSGQAQLFVILLLATFNYLLIRKKNQNKAISHQAWSPLEKQVEGKKQSDRKQSYDSSHIEKDSSTNGSLEKKYPLTYLSQQNTSCHQQMYFLKDQQKFQGSGQKFENLKTQHLKNQISKNVKDKSSIDGGKVIFSLAGPQSPNFFSIPRSYEEKTVNQTKQQCEDRIRRRQEQPYQTFANSRKPVEDTQGVQEVVMEIEETQSQFESISYQHENSKQQPNLKISNTVTVLSTPSKTETPSPSSELETKTVAYSSKKHKNNNTQKCLGCQCGRKKSKQQANKQRRETFKRYFTELMFSAFEELCQQNTTQKSNKKRKRSS